MLFIQYVDEYDLLIFSALQSIRHCVSGFIINLLLSCRCIRLMDTKLLSLHPPGVLLIYRVNLVLSMDKGNPSSVYM